MVIERINNGPGMQTNWTFLPVISSSNWIADYEGYIFNMGATMYQNIDLTGVTEINLHARGENAQSYAMQILIDDVVVFSGNRSLSTVTPNSSVSPAIPIPTYTGVHKVTFKNSATSYALFVPSHFSAIATNATGGSVSFPDTVENWATAHFKDESDNSPSSWLWDFGDGQTSTEQNPIHTYTGEGTFIVTLTTDKGTGVFKVNVIDYLPKVSFTASKENGIIPLAVTLTSAMSNKTSHVWDLGDGTTSTSTNVSKTYSAAGTYQVKLTATNAVGSRTVIKNIIARAPVVPDVDFSATPRDGLTVDFEDLSENTPTGWLWDFGEDPTKIKKTAHTYAVPGTYSVKLTATNPDGSASKTKSIDVTVGNPSPIPVTNFSSVAPVASASLSLSFTDLSTNTPSSWLWDFGDGTTSTLKNPSHSYATAGTYQVKLTATNENGSSSVTKATVVTAPVIPSASWSVSPEVVPVATITRITLTGSGFKSGSKIRITQPENTGIVSKIISISSTQIVFEFLFDENFLGSCGISVIPTSGTAKSFIDALTVE